MVSIYYYPIEVRIRLKGDYRPWSELPAETHFCHCDEQANDIVQNIADTTPDCHEVRWNWMESTQGHYLQPSSD